LLSHPLSNDALGKAREWVLLNYNIHLRNLEIRKTILTNKQVIVSAGIYQNPLDGLNEATRNYLDVLTFTADKTIPTQTESNKELYEEWKELFGKQEEAV
jgi:hypothetical protein